MANSIQRSMFPRQTAPVKRPELARTESTVDLERGDLAHRFRVRMALVHGANYDEPAGFDRLAAVHYHASSVYDARGWGY